MCFENKNEWFIGTKFNNTEFSIASDASSVMLNDNIKFFSLYFWDIFFMLIWNVFLKINSCPHAIILFFELLKAIFDSL